MKHEVEQKFRVDDARGALRLLEDLGVRFGPALRQVDAYFNHPARDFAVTDEALRIRSVGERNVVTYKGPKLDREVKTRQELEQAIADGAEAAGRFAELLVALGFRPTAQVVKTRRMAEFTAHGAVFEIALDEVDGLGTFLELELVVDEAERDVAKARILALQNELGMNAVERRSYLEMVLEKQGDRARSANVGRD